MSTQNILYYLYPVFQVDGERKKVCMEAFCAVLAITKHRLNKAKASLRSGTLLPSPDRRGHHHCRPNAVPKEAIDMVNQHFSHFHPKDRITQDIVIYIQDDTCLLCYLSDECTICTKSGAQKGILIQYHNTSELTIKV